MSLFKRKPRTEEQPLRCPNCKERVPEGAGRCAMCGRDLADVAASESGTRSEEAGQT